MAKLFPLPVLTEILINGTWLDISRFVYERDVMVIQGGATARGDTNQPATVNLTINNRDGRFTPTNPNGAYFPYLQVNTQIRISVNGAISSSGNTYTGYRFWGVVPEWAPLMDVSEHDAYVQIVASGPLRQILKGGGEGSSLARYYATLTGQYAPIAYWPCEEDPGNSDPTGDQIGTGLQGGTNMTIVTGVPVFKAVSKFNGSAPIAVLNGSTWTGVTSAFGASGDDLFLVPGTYQWVATTTTVDVRVWHGGGGGTKGSEGNGGGTGGGGSALNRNSSVAVTPGLGYTVVVGSGGAPGNWNGGGLAGSASSFTGDSVTVSGNPGGGGGANGSPGGSGGAAGTFAGGLGGNDGGSFTQGAGGAGAAGISGNGGAGGNSAFGSAGAGGAAGSGGGGAGGAGSGGLSADGFPGASPGGGGGGGYANNSGHTFGGAGGPGKVELVYTGSGGGTLPSNNVMRFILFVPQHGAKNASVLARFITSGGIARVDCQYRTGGQLRMLGYNSGGGTLFDSGNLAVGADNNTLMVSMELATSGTSIAWAFSAIKPGANGVVNKTNGTLATTMIGSVSQVVVAPNADITKCAMGHFSIQYALIPLYKVSQALNGHDTESGVDRFIRLTTEQQLGNIVQFNETADHWGFETGTQSWAAANGSLTQSSVTHSTSGQQDWPPVGGTHSLLLTASGAGSPSATAPTGLSGQPVNAGDVVSLSIDLYTPATTLTHIYVGLKWYNAAGTLLSESDTVDTTLTLGQPQTISLVGAAAQAPTGAAFYAPTFGDHNTDAVNTLIYADNVRTQPHMGPQTSKKYHEFLDDIQNLDQGLLKEAKTLWGLGYRTRIKLINQAAALTLDFSKGTISVPYDAQGSDGAAFGPVLDDYNVKNDITVQRAKGSKVQVTLQNGAMSVLEPPQGTGRYSKRLSVVAAADEQLAALAEHLLLLGTVTNERYPEMTVNMGRAGIANNAVAPLMSAIAGIEIGDMIQINNLPSFEPAASTQQMVVGYIETLNAYEWTITFNCIAYAPYVQVTTNIRKW